MRKNYFFITSLLLLFLSLVAFSDNLFYDVKQDSNSDPKFIIHGLFFLAWFVLLVVQTGYIRKGNYKAHRTLGVTGMLVGLGVVISTFYVFVAVYKGWNAMPGFVKANRFLTTSFALLLLLAYLQRKNGVKHKRYIYVGTLYVLGPVLDRVAGKLGVVNDMSFILFEAVVWNTLFLSLFIYDWRTLRKIHPISYIGFGWFYVVWILSEVL